MCQLRSEHVNSGEEEQIGSVLSLNDRKYILVYLSSCPFYWEQSKTLFSDIKRDFVNMDEDTKTELVVKMLNSSSSLEKASKKRKYQLYQKYHL